LPGSELAAVGVVADTVRYHGWAGLLPGPARPPFTGPLTRPRWTAPSSFWVAQRLGLGLSDVRDLLTLATPTCARVSQLSSFFGAAWPQLDA